MRKEIYTRTTTLMLHHNLPDYLRTDEVYAAMKRLEVPINEFVTNHAATQAVEFAKWVFMHPHLMKPNEMWNGEFQSFWFKNDPYDNHYNLSQLFSIYLKETGACNTQ